MLDKKRELIRQQYVADNQQAMQQQMLELRHSICEQLIVEQEV